MRIRFSLLNAQGLVTKFTNKLHSHELRLIFSQSDFILLTETWASDIANLSVDGFILIQLNRAEKKNTTKRNSGGIAMYIRQSFYQYCTLIEKDSDDIIWIRIKGRLLNLSHDLYLCLCYIIPSSSSREALVEMDVLDRITNFILKIANETNDSYNILICGDFNSRIGNEKDYVIFDNDANIDIFPIDYETDEVMPRSSQDKIINANGRKLLDFCRLNTLRIANGRLGSDRGVGKYTYVGSTGRSVIDYVIASPNLLNTISTFHVGEPNILSDHCLIDFSMISRNSINELVDVSENVPFENVKKKYAWNEGRAGEYHINLQEEENALRDLSSHLSQVTNFDQIDENLTNFTLLMEKVCDPLFSRKVHSTSDFENIGTDQPSNQPWFDDDCRRFRTLFYSTLNFYRVDKSHDNQTSLVNARSKYKKILRQKRYNYMKKKKNM